MKVYITAPLAYLFNPEKKEGFIKTVNSIDSLLKELKFSTYIAYRDFLQWGKVSFNPNTVFEKLNLELRSSDLLLAINPNDGIGSNIALGVAASLKKPIIIALDKTFDADSLPGLMYQGFSSITKCEIIVYDDIYELRKKLRITLRKFLKSKKSVI